MHPDEKTLVLCWNHDTKPLGISGANVQAACRVLLENFHQTFFSLPSSMQPTRRIRADLIPASLSESRPVKRMDGFSDLYRAYCSKLGCAFRDDIAWDVDNVLCPNGTTVFDPREFELPVEMRDLVALLKSLRFNRSFTGMSFARFKGKLEKEVAVAMGEVFLNNETITAVNLVDCHPAVGLALPSLVQGMSSNIGLAVSNLTLSCNALEDKDITLLASGIGAMSHGLTTLNLADNAFTKKGMQALVQAFQKNERMSQTLMSLSLSFNKIGAEGSSSLSSWLQVPNNLIELLLRDTNINLATVAAGLSKGCKVLRVLDVSDNKFAKGMSVADFAAFLASSSKLGKLILSSTVPSPGQLKDLLRALFSNNMLDELDLDLSDNALGVVGANMMAAELGEANSLASFKCSNNGFGDKGLGILCDALRDHPKLVTLNLTDNFDLMSYRKSKQAASLFVESLGELVTSPKCNVQTLRLASTQKNTQMKVELNPFLVDMASNKSVTCLDISGQGLEYGGFVGLMKMLQLNKTLRKLEIDDNSMDLSCLKSLQHALTKNVTLREIPFPMNDVSLLLSKSDYVVKKDVHLTWQAIESSLNENRSKLYGGTQKRNVVLGRVSMSKRAALLFDDDRDLENLRFAIRVLASQRGTADILTAEQRELLQDADNHHQSTMLLAGLRSQTLGHTLDSIQAELTKVVPQLMNAISSDSNQLKLDVMDIVKKNFPSVADSFPKMEQEMQHFIDEKGINSSDLQQPVVNELVNELIEMIDQNTHAQIKCVVDIIHANMLAKMQSLHAQLFKDVSLSPRSESPPPALSPRGSVTPPESSSPRSNTPPHSSSNPGSAINRGNMVAIPSASGSEVPNKSAADLLRKTSLEPVLQNRIDGPLRVSDHVRTVSDGSNPLTNNRAPVHSPRRSPRAVVPAVNALASPRAVEALHGNGDDVPDLSAKPAKVKVVRRVVRRRPRGPSQMFHQPFQMDQLEQTDMDAEEDLNSYDHL